PPGALLWQPTHLSNVTVPAAATPDVFGAVVIHLALPHAAWSADEVSAWVTPAASGVTPGAVRAWLAHTPLEGCALDSPGMVTCYILSGLLY
ncbi:hypothetical protein OFC55_32670, partial [Escherichia coli]|nr:hypothetical protein [Escherichia coli]